MPPILMDTEGLHLPFQHNWILPLINRCYLLGEGEEEKIATVVFYVLQNIG